MMPKYMITGGYSPASWQRMMEHPNQERESRVAELCQEAGGNLESFYWTFGHDDYVFIAELPDDASASAMSVAMSSTGEIHDQRTVKLLSKDEHQNLLQKGHDLASKYQRPGA